ncbi:MAG: alpha-L-arabinofuranosidase C-terminal domain-containing protein [Chitinophagaceae bacterium]
MKTKLLFTILATAISIATYANQPDSVYLRFYAPQPDGLRIAWSTDRQHWNDIGNHYLFLRSDYGPWGSGKKMWHPSVFLDGKGRWHCVFAVDNTGNVLGHTASENLTLWSPQDYLPKSEMRQYVDKIAVKQRNGDNTYKVAWQSVESLSNYYKLETYKKLLYNENTTQDAVRFSGLKPVDAKLKIDFAYTKKISDDLIGVFFEDINYAADGGLYAELIQNRDFEYTAADRKEWNATTAWKLKGDVHIATENPLHPNNPHYATLGNGATLTNNGFDGIAVVAGDRYDLSLFARRQNISGKIIVRLLDKEGNTIADPAAFNISSKSWKKYNAILTASTTVKDARLEIAMTDSKKTFAVNLDMVSLFPEKTFKNRKNGVRADLAQAIADLKPRFVRFPGGCLTHGNGIDNMYRWKNSVGALEARKPDFNLWGYHQTKGLGFYEFFQFCEDIGASPLPVLAAGVPCQNTGVVNPKNGLCGQQGGIPLDSMDAYIQEVLDLIEYANGDASTRWGKVRAEAGHPQPFHLKYIGIGNEDLISEAFKERFALIFNAVKQKHPEITVIGTVGPFYEGSDYQYGWDFAAQQGVPVVDEHYYVSPGWMLHNQDFYDRYDRNKPKVYLGEYAAHLPGRPSNLETALAEALHLCNVERNGDVVTMTSYAPLLAKEQHTQWRPDLIYFDNTETKTTVDYEVQKLFGNNGGDSYIASDLQLSNKDENVGIRIARSVVKDSKTGDLIIKLVNLLPVEVNIRLENTFSKTEFPATILTGNAADKNTKPTSAIFNINNGKLPPYSFTVVRITK